MEFLDLFGLIQLMPVTSLLAGMFYVSAILFLLVPAVHRWLMARLVMPTPTSQSQVGGLDALRGLAALFIACFHTWQWNQPFFDMNSILTPFLTLGAKAVPFFVVLSGFLIWRAAKKITNIQELRGYTANRFLRVGPLYLVTIMVAALAGTMAADPHPAQRFVAELLFLPTIGFPNISNPPMWSLFPEIVFYAFAPILAAIQPAKPGKRIFALVIVFLVLAITDYEAARSYGLAKYFAIGILASEINDAWKSDRPFLGIVVFAFGCVLLWLEFNEQNWFKVAIETAQPFIKVIHKEPTFTGGLGVTACLLVLGIAKSKMFNSFFSSAPLRILGVISYGVFMWHGLILMADFPLIIQPNGRILLSNPVQSFAPWWAIYAISIPAYIAAGAMSFLLIERRFLLRKVHIKH
ncbi:MAG: acyltransferase [Hydrogenophilales bacterium]|nr:acyltransferase [Hydrogenophilales bacterium]